MTWDRTTGRMTTSVTGGPPEDNLDIDISTYPNNHMTMGGAGIISTINSHPSYSASTIEAYGNYLNTMQIKDTVIGEIKVEAPGCTLWRDDSTFYAYEIDSSKYDIELGVGNGYQCETFSFPLGNINDQSVEVLKAAGFKTGRLINAGSYYMTDSLPIFKLYSNAAWGNSVSTEAEARRRAFALADWLTYTGGVFHYITHGLNGDPADNWGWALKAMQEYSGRDNIVGSTAASVADWIWTEGTPLNHDSTVFAIYQENQADYRLRNGSSAFRTGHINPLLERFSFPSMTDYEGNLVTDESGNFVNTSISVGAYDTVVFMSTNPVIDSISPAKTWRDSSITFSVTNLPDSSADVSASINSVTLPLTQWSSGQVKGTVPEWTPRGSYWPILNYMENEELVADTASTRVRIMVPEIINSGGQ